MKSLTILGVLALFLLLVLPGAVSAADVSVSGSVVDEDLIVTAISPNVGAGAFMFANEPNVISVTVKNDGGLDAASSTVSVVVGSNTYTAAVGALAAGASQTVTVTDPASYTAGASVSYTATADSAGVIAESNEGNNAMTSDALSVLDNGYKGKRWTPTLGGDMTTQVSYTGRYDVKYSAGDSAYKAAKWLTATDTWTSTDIPVPPGATVVSARLYQPYNYNKMASDPAFTASFNGATVSTVATYKDRKNFGGTAGYDYPYGLYVYDVTSQFNTAGNTLVLTPEGTPGTTNDYSINGAYLIVTYSDPAATEKQIFINEEYDMVYSRATYSTNTAEATAYAPFTGVSTTDVGNAKAIAILASAGDTGKSKFFFNSNEYTGFWADYLATPQIGFSVFDVTAALTTGSNEARLQSYDPGTNGDNMYVMNTILVVEKSEATVTVDFTPATQVSGDKPFTVNFDSTVTGYVTSYAWNFGDGGTSDVADPSHQYTSRGTYDVSLTVTGVGTGNTDTETKTALVVVKEPAPVIDFTITPASGVEPLTVAFDATNTGGAVTSWKWEYSADSKVTWTEFASTEDASHTFNDGTYDIRLTATGPDYTVTETKTAAVVVGSSSIVVSVSESAIDFGTMAAGVDEEGATTVTVDVTGGTAWAVTASATNGGYMSTGTTNLANLFEVSNDGKTNWYDLSSNLEFLTGAAGVDGSQVADIKQAIAAADAPGVYSITLTFTGAMA
ncbi:MAG: hypothetical protein A4E38_00040 [Methanoregulaceae archaeon PtaB.Bin108]|nr:MAG: hypothetical protein A4E38_00040 [Methanoregulaceae archaeon PtaB.Bin108]